MKYRPLPWSGTTWSKKPGAAALARCLLYNRWETASAVPRQERIRASRRPSARAVALATLAFTFLNPHVYLDTVVLLGGVNIFGGRGTIPGVVLAVFTLAVLGVDLLLSLELLSVPMTRGWHFQYIKEWIPAFGIRYHVAIDGISL